MGRASATRSLAYIPALDGLRALAVGVVVAYHLGYGGVPGGYIGVEVFFVLSGWLVCALLVAEREATGRISLAAFWRRRARRLLPAVAVVVAATLAVAIVVRYPLLPSLGGDALSAGLYVFNWRLILDQQPYFEAAQGPSPLLHLWSLSIEEQFYLVLPLLLTAGLAASDAAHRWCARRGIAWPGNLTPALGSAPGSGTGAWTRPLGALLAMAAVASTLWRLRLLDPIGDPSRVYFGTDTRAAGLLAGAALALFWRPGRKAPARRRRVDAAGLAALLVLLWYATQVSEHSPGAFGRSFTFAQVAALLLIRIAVSPAGSRTGRLLSAAPLRWVGRHSYGIYLWHWPIVVTFARAPGEQPERPAKALALVAATVGLAALSHRFVEQPIRRHGFGPLLVRSQRWVLDRVAGRTRVAVAVTGASLLVVGILTGLATVRVQNLPPAGPPSQLAASVDEASARAGRHTAAPGPGGSTSEDATAPGAPSTTPSAGPGPASGSASPSPGAAPTSAPAPTPATFPSTTAIGDSVMAGAHPALAARMGPSLVLEAEVGRQVSELPDRLRQLADTTGLGEVVVIHLGSNGAFSEGHLDEAIDMLDDHRVLLVNTKVPRRWEGEVNGHLADVARTHDNVELVDWHSLANAEPNLLHTDGYHLTPAGAERYADLVTTTVAAS